LILIHSTIIPVAPGDLDAIAVTIPDEFDDSERMIPTEIHSTDARPRWAGKEPRRRFFSLFSRFSAQ
jgi:hypothetical protein